MYEAEAGKTGICQFAGRERIPICGIILSTVDDLSHPSTCPAELKAGKNAFYNHDLDVLHLIAYWKQVEAG